MITNRLRERTVTLAAATITAIVGRDLQGQGGLEGVLNGATAAVATITSSIASATTVQVGVRAARGATLTIIEPAAPLVVPANDALAIRFEREDLAAYEIGLYAQNAAGGDLSVAWEATR